MSIVTVIIITILELVAIVHFYGTVIAGFFFFEELGVIKAPFIQVIVELQFLDKLHDNNW